MKGRTSASTLALISIFVSFFSITIFAGLSEDESTIDRDQNAFHCGNRQMQSHKSYRVHMLNLDSGILVKEFVNNKGAIFAVTWEGATAHPNLENILGSHFGHFQNQKMAYVKGHRMIDMVDDKYTVQFGGQMGDMRGRAWDSSLFPQGFSTNDITYGR